MRMSDDESPIDGFKAGDTFFGQMIEAGVADDQFIKEIVEMFIEEGKQSLKLLSDAISKRNLVDISLYAHKLKSSFLMFDMNQAHKLAVILERINGDNLYTARPYFNQLKQNCDTNFILLHKKYLSSK